MSDIFADYERGIAPARLRFEQSPVLAVILAGELPASVLEQFLLQFCSIGVQMTEPVEGWIGSAADRCAESGFDDLARALCAHAHAESGHHLMMIADVHALVNRWNSRGNTPIDAETLLAQPPTAGARRYIQVHEENIAGSTPWGQVAIEYEIERLPVLYGEKFVNALVQALGRDILGCLTFLTEHVTLDVGHTEFNRRALEKLLRSHPETLDSLVRAGSAALDAYEAYLSDCLLHATAETGVAV